MGVKRPFVKSVKENQLQATSFEKLKIEIK